MGLAVVSLFKTENRSLGLILPAGYLLMLLSFEIVTLPILLAIDFDNFNYVVRIYTPVMILLAGVGSGIALKCAGGVSGLKEYFGSMLGIYRLHKDSKNDSLNGQNAPTGKFSFLTYGKYDGIIVWIIAAAVLVYILVMTQTRVIFDGDDAYYVVQSLIAQQNKSMYVTLPYTGGASPLDMRHAMAVFTMWISYIGTMTGLHSTILCHTVLPLVLIPLTLVTYMEIGIRFLRRREDMLPYFVLFTEVIILFGRVSILTSEAFLLGRTWQGKSMAANFLFPMTLIAIYSLFKEKGNGKWLFLLLVNAVAGIFSSLAVVLVCILMAIGALWYTIYTRKLINLLRVCLCCAPSAVYMGLYVLFTYVTWK